MFVSRSENGGAEEAMRQEDQGAREAIDELVPGKSRVSAQFFFGANLVCGLALIANNLQKGGNGV